MAKAFAATSGGRRSGNAVTASPTILDQPQDSPVVTGWHRTQVNMDKFSVTWSIVNFTSYLEKNVGCRGIVSPNFDAGFVENLSWSFFLPKNPSKNTSRDDYYLPLFLGLLCSKAVSDDTFKHYRVNLSIANVDPEKTLLKKDYRYTGRSSGTRNNMNFFLFGDTHFINLDFLANPAHGFLPDDVLTIICEVNAATECIESWEPSGNHRVELPEYKLPQDLGSLFENQEFSDLTICANGKEVRVHKAILAARSPVFAAMFNHQMKETEQNLVVIADVDYKVLREMVMYIYTGRSPNVEKIAEDLLIAADKYDVSGLKMLCEMVLSSKISVDNATDLLVLADTYSARQLKPLIVSFMSKWAKDVIKTQAWKNMTLTHPHLVAEAYEALASQ